MSYTEKEYDYAREVKKPVLAFVHGNRGGIPRDKTENDPEKRPKLEAFIQKVRRSPVSFFTAAHDLATQVTVSFVNLRDRRPAVGFIRTDQVADLKRYAEVLEENNQLRNEISMLKLVNISPFENSGEKVTLIVELTTINTADPDNHITSKEECCKALNVGELFVFIA